jgi:branched-chain amino acid transport system substrate-binding protein
VEDVRRLRFFSLWAVAPPAALVVAALAGAGCAPERPYRIGVVLGTDGLRAALLAADEVNARGGINGRRLELRQADVVSYGEAKVALATAEQLASDDTVLAVVGHASSSASLAAAQVYNAQGVVQIAPTTSSPLYSKAGPFSFRLIPSDVYQGAFLADQVLRRATRPRLAVVTVNDDYGRSLRMATLDRLRAGGVTPAYDSPYAEAEQFKPGSEILAGLEHAKPDMLLWIGGAYDYVAIAKPLRRALPSLEVLASDRFGGPTLDRDRQHLLDGVRYVHSVNLANRDTALRRFRAEFEREGGTRLTDQAVLSYDAVMLLAEAIRHAGGHRVAIRDWLARVGRDVPSYRGLSGPIAFPSGGDRAPTYFLEEIGGVRTDSEHTAAGSRSRGISDR